MSYVFDDEIPQQSGKFVFDDGVQSEAVPSFNSVRLAAENAGDLAGDLMAAGNAVAKDLDRNYSLGGLVWKDDDLLPSYLSGDEWSAWQQGGANMELRPLEDAANYWRDVDAGYVPNHTWEVLKDTYAKNGAMSLNTIAELGGFGFEQGVGSISHMVAALANLPAYVAARSGGIGEARTQNKGLSEMTSQEVAEAFPAALASALFERIGAKGVVDAGADVGEAVMKPVLETAVKEGAKAAGKEGATELVQEGLIEPVGEQLGTNKQLDPMEMAERGLAGMLAGGVFGGGAGGTVAAGRTMLNNMNVKTDQPVEEIPALPSPPPVTVDSEGNARRARGYPLPENDAQGGVGFEQQTNAPPVPPGEGEQNQGVAGLLEQTSDPMIVFKDGSVARASEVQDLLNSMSIEERSELYGYGNRPVESVIAGLLEQTADPMIVFPDGSTAPASAVDEQFARLPIEQKARLLGMGQQAADPKQKTAEEVVADATIPATGGTQQIIDDQLNIDSKKDQKSKKLQRINNVRSALKENFARVSGKGQVERDMTWAEYLDNLTREERAVYESPEMQKLLPAPKDMGHAPIPVPDGNKPQSIVERNPHNVTEKNGSLYYEDGTLAVKEMKKINDAQAEQERQEQEAEAAEETEAEAAAIEAAKPIRAKGDKPFKTWSAAKQAATRLGRKDMEPVEVDGGFELQQIQQDEIVDQGQDEDYERFMAHLDEESVKQDQEKEEHLGTAPADRTPAERGEEAASMSYEEYQQLEAERAVEGLYSHYNYKSIDEALEDGYGDLGGYINLLKTHIDEGGTLSDEALASVEQHAPDRLGELGGRAEFKDNEAAKEQLASLKPSEMKAYIIREVMQRIEQADTLEQVASRVGFELESGNRVVDRIAHLNSRQVDKIGHAIIDVPGDVTYHVLNIKERLEEFKATIEKSNGFSDRPSTTRGPRLKTGQPSRLIKHARKSYNPDDIQNGIEAARLAGDDKAVQDLEDRLEEYNNDKAEFERLEKEYEGTAGMLYSNPFDPALLKPLWRSMAKVLGRKVDDIKADWETLQANMTGLRGTRSMLGKFGHIGEVIGFSNDGMLRTLAKRYNAEVINEIADMLHAKPGSGRVTGETYGEAVGGHTGVMLNRLGKVLEQFGRNEQALNQITKLVQNPDSIRPGTPIHDAASEIVTMLREEYEYQREAGIDMGEVKKGYFPRMADVAKVLRDTEGFLNKAAQAYMATYDGLTMDEAKEMAEAWANNLLLSDIGIRTDSNDFNAPPGAGAPTPKHHKSRVFSKEADSIMADFLITNPVDALNTYFIRSARRAEWERRFGGDKWKNLKQRMMDAGAHAAIDTVIKAIQSTTGQLPSSMGQHSSSVLSWLRVWSALTFLPRATISSLSEFTIPAIRAGNGLVAARALVTSFRALAKGSSTEELREISEEILGVTGQVAIDMLMQQRIGGQIDRKMAQQVTNQFFTRTGLHQWTEATRIASLEIAQWYIKRVSKDLVDGNSRKKSAILMLKEMGINEDQAMDFAQQVLSGEGQTAADLKTGGEFANQYKLALTRFVNQSIMNPDGSERPRFANHAVGGLAYNLMSFLYSFHKNVLQRNGRLALEAANLKNDYSMADRAAMMAPMMLITLPILVQLGLGELRDEVLFKNPSRKDGEERTATDKVITAISRSGALGAYDPLINLVTSARYDKDPATVMTGPVLGLMGEFFNSMVDLKYQNSENTNTAERNAAKKAYSLFVQPTLNAAFTLAPGMPLVGAAGIQAASHPQAREGFMDLIAGEKVDKKSRRNKRRERRESRR